MARNKTASAPTRSKANNGTGAVGLSAKLQAALRAPEIIGKALKDIRKLKEQHAQQGRALFRLREQLVLVEDTYLEQEKILDGLSAWFSDESDALGAGLGEHTHARLRIKKRRHTTGASVARPDLEEEDSEVTGNASGTSDQGDCDASEELLPAWPRESEAFPWLDVEDSSTCAPVASDAADSRASAHGRIEGHIHTPAETWETYAGNSAAFQQPQPAKRKQTARRSQPHFKRLNSMSSRKRKPNVPSTPKNNPSGLTALSSDVNPPAQRGREGEYTDSQSDTRMEFPGVRTVEQGINSLPLPPKMNIPAFPRKFSNTLLTSSIGGNASTFARVGSLMLGKQVFRCPELIKVNPEAHEYAPLTGQHGALTLIGGQDGSGELGKIYPLFRKDQNVWEYAGEYRVAERIEVPVATWKQWSNETRQSIATRVDRSGWGQNLLLEKGLANDEGELHSLQIRDILELFEKPDAPNLRMSWTLLQCVGYAREKHDILAAKQDGEAGPRPPSGRSLNRDLPIDLPKSHTKRSAQKQVATPDANTPSSKKRRGRQGRAIPSPSGDSDTRPAQYNRSSNQRRAKPTEGQSDDDNDDDAATTTSSYDSRSRTAEPATLDLSSVPLDELGEEHVKYSLRGRRTRKDIDYRIKNRDLDNMIFKDHF
ncbi:MAG: hypothetical protein M1839_005654 [Geoglossum umbratile]|nr:MAG: hypothetical protein M1839_005654 [Geoglossum umbratile]